MVMLILGLSGLNLTLAVASALVAGLFLAVLFLRRDSSKGSSSSVLVKRATSVLAPVLPRASVELASDKPTVNILYGTQTGTAERFSKQLAAELRKRHEGAAVHVLDLENYKAPLRLSKEKVVVFNVATYGDGEPTDDAAEFYSWLLKEVEEVEAGTKQPSLEGVRYGVFGLGNKQYEHFNAVGKKLHSGLLTLGASPLVRRGDGDDDGCIDDDYDKWCAELLDGIDASDLLGSRDQNGDATSAAAELVAAYDVKLAPPGAAEASPFPLAGTGASAASPFWATVTAVRELHTAESTRSCVHVELDIAGAAPAGPLAASSVVRKDTSSSSHGVAASRYETGDHVAVYSQNLPAVVDEVAALLGVAPGTLFTLSIPPSAAAASTGAKGGGKDGSGDASTLAEPFAGPLALRTALAYFADVLSSPHREALAALGACATDPKEAERLKRLGSLAGRQDYQDYIHKPQRSLLEVLRAFPSAKPTLGAFFGAVAPRPAPRFYSISSSARAHPASLHVTCAVVKDVTPSGRTHEGLCSTWLARHAAGTRLPVYVRRSHFKLPADPATPVIMVGPGTGLAPFRGFLQERAALAEAGVQLGPCHLFFGCRNKRQDYIYEAELRSYLRNGTLSALHVAFSRDAGAGGAGGKDYVQAHLTREGAAVWPLLAAPDKGHFYVCGDAKHMAKDVHRALVAVVEQHKKCSLTQAEAFVKEMVEGGRYQRDVW